MQNRARRLKASSKTYGSEKIGQIFQITFAVLCSSPTRLFLRNGSVSINLIIIIIIFRFYLLNVLRSIYLILAILQTRKISLATFLVDIFIIVATPITCTWWLHIWKNSDMNVSNVMYLMLCGVQYVFWKREFCIISMNFGSRLCA